MKIRKDDHAGQCPDLTTTGCFKELFDFSLRNLQLQQNISVKIWGTQKLFHKKRRADNHNDQLCRQQMKHKKGQ